MAQYYQVIDQSDSINAEDLQTLYPNIIENQQPVRYVLNPEEQQVQQPILVPGEFMVVDNALDQSTITFQNQFELPQQQIYYMESDDNPTETAPRQVVLNHMTGVQSPQKVIMMQNPGMIVQPPALVARQVPQKTVGMQQNAVRAAQIRGLVPQVQGRAPIRNDVQKNSLVKGGVNANKLNRSVLVDGTKKGVVQRAATGIPVLRGPQPHRMPLPKGRSLVQNRPPANTQIIEQNSSAEAAALEDGRLITLSDFKKLLAEKKRVSEFGSFNEPTTVRQPAVKPAQKTPTKRQPAPKPSPARAGASNFQAPNRQFQPQKPPQNDNLQRRQSLMARPQIARIIQSQNQEFAKMPAVLRNFVPPPEIKDIISKTSGSAEFQDSIRMFVLLANGEQRLITFTVPKEDCTIQDILEQVGVPLQSDTKIAISETNADGINLVVSVGLSDDESDLIESEEQPLTPPNSQIPVPDLKTETPPKAPTPELSAPEPEQPKYIPGKLAVCQHCGFLSDDFNKCIRCLRKFPDEIKAFTVVPSIPQGRKVDPKNKIAINLKSNINSPLRAAPLVKTASPTTPKRKSRAKVVEQEPVILMLSSDEEGEDDEKSSSSDQGKLKESDSESLLKEPSFMEISRDTINEKVAELIEGCMASASLQCRTIRIGSLRYGPVENVLINSKEMILKLPPTSESQDGRELKIQHKMVVKVLICFHKLMPVLFFYVTPAMGEIIRKELEMTEGSEPYFDPLSAMESYKRITLLPESIGEELKSALKVIYGQHNNVMDELSPKEANTILIRTCPKETAKAVQFSIASNTNCSGVKQLFIYPPGKGGLSVNTEDYLCLAQDQFLNDVIIDFYLKHLLLNLPKEKQEKVHVFSTFFYKRLTTKPTKPTRRSHPAELDPTLTPAEKRHSRVKNWTKHVNLFDKDYIVVPINENAHWFLSIICYPNMNGPHTFDNKPHTVEVVKRKKKPATATIGNVTITPVKPEKLEKICDDESDKDEAEGDDSELESGTESEDAAPAVAATVPTPSKEKRIPIKQPCILIFDSLIGASRSRVIATLRDYLTCEYKAKMHQVKVYNKDVIKGACPKVPQQTNYTDCGLYLLQYVESFLANPIKDYAIPIGSLKTWFDEITVTKKREDISNLIKDLMLKYTKDVTILPSITLPTLNGELVENPPEEEEEEEEMPPEDEEDEEEEMLEKEMESEGTDYQPSSSSAENSPTKLSECQSDGFMEEIMANASLTPDVEVPKVSNRDTMSYLKSKRIIRHKPNDISSAKRFKQTDD